MLLEKPRSFKPLIALILALSLYFATTYPLLANNMDSDVICQTQTVRLENQTYTISTLQSNSTELHVIKVIFGNTTHLVSYNELTGDISVTTTDGTLKFEEHCNIHNSSNIEGKSYSISKNPSKSPSVNDPVIVKNSDNWWGYAYSCVTYTYMNQSLNLWNLVATIKNEMEGKMVEENPSNSTNLFSFKSAVDDLVSNELACAAAVGVGITSAIAGAIASLETVTLSIIIGLLTAMGGTVTAAVYFYNAYRAAQDANLYFARLTP